MRHNLPSVKTLKTIAGERARELRSVLEITDRLGAYCVATSGKYPATENWLRKCYNMPSMQEIKLDMCDAILDTSGVEYIPAGKGAKSPAIWYCNAGDTYANTLLYVSGRGYRVGCWGDIVERGNYE